MKKIVLLIAVITAFLFSTHTSAQTLTRGKVMDSLNTKPLAYFYTVEDRGSLYWGCNSKLHHYGGNESWLNEIKAEGIQFTMIKIKPEQLQFLIIKLTILVRYQKLSPAKAFDKIYEFTKSNPFDKQTEWNKKLMAIK